ncbi:ABC transporter permease [Gayadomonas joobiniege]|uniref:ABC transporter permease n=1 Tax=Gayadomonas joobiniege TaxID=1234606 RepID=UPI0003679258|nr:ABC transporter permease [Gayadomonas joobiniege]
MNTARIRQILPPIIVGFILISLWYLAIFLFDIPIFQLPTPHEIIEAGMHEKGTLISGALQTTLACLIGFFTSLIGGVLLSILLAYSSWAYKGFYPYILLLKMMPVIVLAPIIILWFGQGLASITVITFLICFFPIVANTTMGLCSTDKNLVDVFRAYNASAKDEMLKLRIPYAMPYFLTGLKVAAALTPIGALYGDTVAGMGAGSEAGLGFVVVVFSSQLKIPALYAAAFTACAIGFIFVGLVNFLHWWMLHKWHDSYAQNT